MTDNTPSEAAMAIELWFFRDISDEQRGQLIALCLGRKVADEAKCHNWQRICLKRIIRNLIDRHLPAAEPDWRDIATAPKDGSMLELLVDYSDGDHPLEDELQAATIGFNDLSNTGEDEWKFVGWCWTHDHFVDGKGKVIGWRHRATPPDKVNSDAGLLAWLEQAAANIENGAIEGWEAATVRSTIRALSAIPTHAVNAELVEAFIEDLRWRERQARTNDIAFDLNAARIYANIAEEAAKLLGAKGDGNA